ncbi:uncharacterized protein LOC133525240 [Cydia pomonella]|uniref:uncharacterized protein LOC133525240 n=1 Tax=Cydia pomonella TaxID=82600 RepID=UPI002ADD38F1|nr:uncharacterized protein LOC133525240 [Cydia pomonella]
MNISGFGAIEVKNKIKNLRSTYQQEIKKIQDSKKSGAGLSNVYTSNVKWLKEMEEVFSKDLKKKVYENISHSANEDTGPQDNSPATSSHSNNNQEVPAITSDHQQVPVTVTTTTTSATITNTINTARGKKRARDIFQAVSDLKKLNEDVNSEKETVFDVFGRSVALQLKNLSTENALLAQNRIQNILTDYGIKELRQSTAYHSSSSNRSDQRPSSVHSDTTYASSQNTYHHQFPENYDEDYASQISQSILAASSPVHNVNSPPNSVSTNDILANAMYAAFQTDGRQQM